MPPNENPPDHSKSIDLGFKILSALIIPSLMWVNSISVKNALLQQRVADHEKTIEKLEEQIINVRLNKQALEATAKEVKSTRETLAEIRNILRP